MSQTLSTDGRGAFQDPTHVSFWNSNSFWYYTRADQNRFIDCPVQFQANRLKNYFPSEWHREHQIVYVKADLLKVAGARAGRRGNLKATSSGGHARQAGRNGIDAGAASNNSSRLSEPTRLTPRCSGAFCGGDEGIWRFAVSEFEFI